MSQRAAAQRALSVYNSRVTQREWQGFHEFEHVWVERLALHCFMRRGYPQSCGFFIGVMFERQQFHALIPVFKTTLTSAEDIFYAVELDQTTVQTELRFFLMRVHNMTAQEAMDLAGFSWTTQDPFEAILERMNSVLLHYALPWFDGKIASDL